MQTVKGKLKSKRGVTIIMALVFFLIAAIIGSIVITAASASVGRLTHLRREQQAYLTVSSAAKLARDVIADTKFTAVVVDGGSPSYSVTPDSSLSSFIQAVSASSFTNPAWIPGESFQIIPDSDSTTSAVTASVTDIKAAGSNRTIVITFESDDTENPYVLMLSVPFIISENTTFQYVEVLDEDGEDAGSYTITTVTTTYSYGSGVIAKGDI